MADIKTEELVEDLVVACAAPVTTVRCTDLGSKGLQVCFEGVLTLLSRQRTRSSGNDRRNFAGDARRAR